MMSTSRTTSSSIDAYVERVLDRIPQPLPQRRRIEVDLRAHLGETVAAGVSEHEAIDRMGPPEEVAKSYLEELNLPLASLGQRLLAFLVDLGIGLAFLLFFALFVGLGVFGARMRGGLGPMEGVGLVALVAVGVSAFLLSFLYFPVLETLFSQTVGKRALGICVVKEDGARIGGWDAVVRRIPMFFEFWWLDALVALFTEKRQRAFDLVAKTLVVRCS